MTDNQIGGLLLLWLLAGYLSRRTRSAFRLGILTIVAVTLLCSSCTRGGYCYHEARLVGRSFAHAQAVHQRHNRRHARQVQRHQVREALRAANARADARDAARIARVEARLRAHSELRRADVPRPR